MQLTKKIELGGREFEFGPLNMFEFLRVKDRLHLLGKINEESFSFLVEIIHTSLALDYPDIELAFVRRWVLPSNINLLADAFAEVNGLVKKQAEQVQPIRKRRTGKK